MKKCQLIKFNTIGNNELCYLVPFSYLSENLVDTMIHYPVPIYKQEAYNEFSQLESNFPITNKISDEILSLPIYPFTPHEDLKRVCELLNNW